MDNRFAIGEKFNRHTAAEVTIVRRALDPFLRLALARFYLTLILGHELVVFPKRLFVRNHFGSVGFLLRIGVCQDFAQKTGEARNRRRLGPIGPPRELIRCLNVL